MANILFSEPIGLVILDEDWHANRQPAYVKNTVVRHNGRLWAARATPLPDEAPGAGPNWVAWTRPATTSTLGGVIPDGVTTFTNDEGVLSVKVDNIGFTILYPEGSAENPPIISANQRVEIENPFGDAPCIVQAEIRINNVWGDSGAYTDLLNGIDRAWFVKASTFNSLICVISGVNGVSIQSRASGSPLAVYSTVDSAPYRVKVWKLKGNE